MKKVLSTLTLFIAFCSAVKAQTDFCKDITKWNSKSTVYFESPTPGDKKEEVSQFGFVKAINATGTTIYFKLGVCFEDPEKTGTDASITFEDDDVIKFSDLKITKGEKNNINMYVYSALIPLSTDDLAKFKTKKFKSYTFMGAKRGPGFGNPKVKIMAYANCMDSFTEGPAIVPPAPVAATTPASTTTTASTSDAKAPVTTRPEAKKPSMLFGVLNLVQQ